MVAPVGLRCHASRSSKTARASRRVRQPARPASARPSPTSGSDDGSGTNSGGKHLMSDVAAAIDHQIVDGDSRRPIDKIQKMGTCQIECSTGTDGLRIIWVYAGCDRYP